MTLNNSIRYSLIGGAFLLPLIFFGTTLFPLPLAKTVLVLLMVVIGLGVYIMKTLRSGEVSLPWHALYIPLILLPIIYAISAFLGSERSLGLFGYNLEAGTCISLLLGVLLLILVSLLDREKWLSLEILGATVSAGVFVVIIGAIKIFSGGSLLNIGIFSGIVGNTVGSWTDYSMFLSVMVVVTLLALEMLEFKKVVTAVLYALLALSLSLLMILNFSIAWVLVLIVSGIIYIYSATVERRFHDGVKERRFFPLALTVVILALIFVINPKVKGGDLRTALSSRFNVQNLDIRPSFSATRAVSTPVLKSHPLFGSGPDTFAESWLLYKPADLNTTVFWNTTFPFGVGFLPTQVSSVGIVGTIAWVAFLVLLLILMIKALGAMLPRRERFVIVASLSTTFLLWAGLLLYVPSPAIFYLTFLLTGVFVASLVQAGIVPMRSFVFREKPIANFSTVLAATVIGAIVLVSAVYAGSVAASVVYFEKAQILANNQGKADDVEALLNKALSYSKNDLYYRAMSELAMARAQAAYAATDGTQEENAAAFQKAIADAISKAEMATSVHPESYGNWISLGNVYAALVPAPLSVDGAYDSAKSAYKEATKRNPLSPEVPLLLAKLDYSKNDLNAARSEVDQAISLKKDYADAYYLLTQIEVGQNDVAKAIEAAKTTAVLSPNNAGVYFELGLLLYSSKDYQNAAAALREAEKIVPNYANAKYFLGLSLGKLGDKEGALAEFQDLLKSNPDNADLPIIIRNLQAGREALYQAPSGAHPEKRPTPPITTAE